ncbi:MAG: hypothetical protein KF883_13040 [Thermomicrobiales bacterium]|nr:hypothetical protein [Thermomicrobiales bacterium]
MSSGEFAVQEVVDALSDALREVLGADGFDLLPDDQGMTIAADDWSLRIESGPRAVAWLAVDDEPDDASMFQEAIREIVGAGALGALWRANAAAGHALTALLTAANDPFGLALAAMLESDEGVE